MSAAPDTFILVAAGDVKPGDRLDLAGDSIADKPGSVWEFELYVVENVNRETDDCVVLYSQESGGNFAFPIAHKLKLVRHETDMDWTARVVLVLPTYAPGTICPIVYNGDSVDDCVKWIDEYGNREYRHQGYYTIDEGEAE